MPFGGVVTALWGSECPGCSSGRSRGRPRVSAVWGGRGRGPGRRCRGGGRGLDSAVWRRGWGLRCPCCLFLASCLLVLGTGSVRKWRRPGVLVGAVSGLGLCCGLWAGPRVEGAGEIRGVLRGLRASCLASGSSSPRWSRRTAGGCGSDRDPAAPGWSGRRAGCRLLSTSPSWSPGSDSVSLGSQGPVPGPGGTRPPSRPGSRAHLPLGLYMLGPR